MIDFVREFCSECGGRCCRKFPVYQFLVDNKIMTAEFSGVGTRETLLHLSFEREDYQSMKCFYYEIGGCPNFVKPDACRFHVCRYFNTFILGLDWDRQKYGWDVKESTLRIYKALIGMG